ncbi:MAG: M1 family metallopeptidase [Planctomycetes bacterium]|nr:M1 family metallopeptidase [Planctomycetota bacterium]
MSRPSPRCSIPLLIAALATAQGPRNVSGGPLIPEQACYDVQHYALAITVDPEARTIEGVLAMRALATAESARLALDLDPALTARSAQFDGTAVPFTHEAGRIWITPKQPPAPGSPFRVEVAYGGSPRQARNPPWDGGFTWAETKDGSPWIATSCQGEGADLWWPCKDHPSDKPDGFDLHCTVPKGLVVASNGTQVGKPERRGEHVTWHWRVASPISNYNVALNIAPYVALEDTFTCIDGTKTPVRWFVLPESRQRAKRCMEQFLDHVHCFEEILGPYPFRAEKYGLAETPHLGMEHQTILAYGNGFRDEQYDWLHNHELAHEWWGNLVTCRDWKDFWIHEGFGTYMQPLYRERRFGRKAYQDEMRRQSALLMNRTAIAPRESRNSFEIQFGGGGGNDVYYKGSWVLHTLRWQLGEAKFFAALREFCYPTEAARKATDGSQCRFVDTDEFVALCSQIAGEDLGWFFAVYLRQAGLPRLQTEKAGGVLRLSWQVPGGLPFALPVPVRLHGEEVRVPMPAGRGELEVGDADFVIDPELRILMLRSRSGR